MSVRLVLLMTKHMTSGNAEGCITSSWAGGAVGIAIVVAFVVLVIVVVFDCNERVQHARAPLWLECTTQAMRGGQQ